MTNLFRTAALWPAEQAINHLLSTDNHVKAQFAQFVGKSLEIKVHTPTIYATAFINSDRISLNAASAEELSIEATASVSGEVTELLNTLASNKEAPLANLKIEISGDAQFVQELLKTIQSLDIQWSDLATPITGDVVTNEVDELVKNLKVWSSDTKKRFKKNLNDYIMEEARYVPYVANVEKFNEDLDALRFKIDRVKAKTDLLYQRLEELND
ncbi:MAG: SCP2 domain-containing protein [Pseudohongiellaceae bacterium]